MQCEPQEFILSSHRFKLGDGRTNQKMGCQDADSCWEDIIRPEYPGIDLESQRPGKIDKAANPVQGEEEKSGQPHDSAQLGPRPFPPLGTSCWHFLAPRAPWQMRTTGHPLMEGCPCHLHGRLLLKGHPPLKSLLFAGIPQCLRPRGDSSYCVLLPPSSTSFHSSRNSMNPHPVQVSQWRKRPNMKCHPNGRERLIFLFNTTTEKHRASVGVTG